MLGKLMKHEFRATGRIMLPLFAVLAALAVLTNISARVMLGMDSKPVNVTGTVIIMLFVLANFAVAVMAMVLMVQRFKNNLLSDEGYLMFTLPASVHKLVWSKLLASAVWFIVSGIAIGVSCLIAVFKVDFVKELAGLLSQIFSRLTAYYALNGAAVIAEMLAVIFLACTTFCLMFYAAMSLGYSFDRKKSLMSVVFYVAFMFAGEMVSTFAISGLANNLDFSAATPMGAVHITLLLMALYQLLCSAVFYAITTVSLKKKLNLE